MTLSADATADRGKWFIAQGATCYLTKPFNIPGILDLIDRLDTPPKSNRWATCVPEIGTTAESR